MSEEWQRARLIPVSGITGADEQERRGVSALLAVMESVKEFGRALTALSAPNGRGGLGRCLRCAELCELDRQSGCPAPRFPVHLS
jgi:hypothetical protein